MGVAYNAGKEHVHKHVGMKDFKSYFYSSRGVGVATMECSIWWGNQYTWQIASEHTRETCLDSKMKQTPLAEDSLVFGRKCLIFSATEQVSVSVFIIFGIDKPPWRDWHAAAAGCQGKVIILPRLLLFLSADFSYEMDDGWYVVLIDFHSFSLITK